MPRPPTEATDAGEPSGPAGPPWPDPPLVPPSAVDLDGLRREARRQSALLRRQRRGPRRPFAVAARALAAGLAWFWTLLPARLLMHYLFHGGPLMAAGLSYNMLFASVGIIVIGFATIGRWLGGDSEVRDLAVDAVDETIPGLINTGQGGVIPLSVLESTQPYTIAWLVGLGILAFTAWRWAAGIRLACRRMFEVPPSRGMPAAAVPRDVLGLLLLTAVLSVSLVLNAEAAGALDLLGEEVRSVSWLAPVLDLVDGDTAYGLATLVGVGADALMLYLMIRGVAQLRPSPWPMTCILVLGVAGNYLLRAVGALLIQAMTANPFLLSAAILVGVLLWFYFFSQIILISAAFGALVQADTHGGHPQPRGETRAVTPVAAQVLDDVRATERAL